MYIIWKMQRGMVFWFDYLNSDCAKHLIGTRQLESLTSGILNCPTEENSTTEPPSGIGKYCQLQILNVHSATIMDY